MPFHAHMQRICHRGYPGARPAARLMASIATHTALSPMGWLRLRPRAMNPDIPIYDIHTHTIRPGALVNIRPGDTIEPGIVYSTGIHPWDTSHTDINDIDLLRQYAIKPEIAAIGETGLDPLRGAPIEHQEEIFRAHIALSEELGKPLIIHCVKTAHRILALHKALRPQSRWILHGFRGNADTARQLTDAGIMLSLGPRFNPEVPLRIPHTMLLPETDDSPIPITEVASLIGLPLRDLRPLLNIKTDL